ncbi:DMT family transporter [Anoxybacillus gonensis]|uniref:DMT family transporter n=1 Tax=Anoxybacillus gonensis TaxID=198467 RepID=A0AAW7TGS4_9BACL|nr:DMT family transporter [Anoxybacillus gonensis]MDO0877417.1 DMT family transporter [Anoxybacillus gonensis]
MLAAVSYAAHIVVTGQLTKHSDSIALGILQLSACGIISLFVSLWLESPTVPTSSAWVAIVALGILCSAIRLVVQTVAQKYTTATHAGLIFSLEPVFAVLFGYLFLGEVLSIKGYIFWHFIRRNAAETCKAIRAICRIKKLTCRQLVTV